MSFKIIAAGDTHGFLDAWKYQILPDAKKEGANIVLQVGDFGLWPGGDGLKYLEKLARWATAWGVTILWLDGNHDWFDQLEALGAFGADHPFQIGDMPIFYLPRGYRWEWEGVTCLALGGAYSVDKNARTRGIDWWPQEEITFDDMDRAMEGGPVDVMFAHDVFEDIMVPGVHAHEKDRFPEARHNRQRLQYVIEKVQPKLYVHGHYHVAYEKRYKGTTVVGLNMSGPWNRQRLGQTIVIDFPSLEWSMPDQRPLKPGQWPIDFYPAD